MSDEQRKGDETDVEAHHRRAGENDEPAEEDETEFEAHASLPNVRMD
jgi:hypothetical protein